MYIQLYLNLIMDERELERILDEAFQSVIQTNFPQASTILERIGQHITTQNDSVGEQSTNTVSANEDISHDISYSEVPIRNCSVQPTNAETTNHHTNTTSTNTTSTNTSNTNTSNTNVNTTTTNIPFVQQSHVQQPNTHILDITHNLFMNYHENMRLYQHNLSLMFRHLQSLSRNSTVVSSNTSSNNNTSRTRPRNRTSGLFSNLQDNLALDIQSFPFYGIFPSGNSEPSHSIPTIQQFTNATEMCTYTHDSLGIISRTCPITLEEFQEHEQVHKIKHCGHFFKITSLQNWFSRNSHCPVCRYDIRTYNDEDSQQTQSSFARQGSRSNSL